VEFLDVEDIEHRVLPGGSGWPGRSALMSRPVLWSQVPTNWQRWRWPRFRASWKSRGFRQMLLALKPLPRPGQPAPPDSTQCSRLRVW